MPSKLTTLTSAILILVAVIIQNGRHTIAAATVNATEVVAATTVKANFNADAATRKARDVASPPPLSTTTTASPNEQQRGGDTVCSICMEMGVSMRSIYLLILIVPLTFLILGLIAACAAAYVLSSVLGRLLMELEQTVVTFVGVVVERCIPSDLTRHFSGADKSSKHSKTGR